MKWEYLNWQVIPGVELIDDLNELGVDGWEVVCAWTENRLILKRPNTDADYKVQVIHGPKLKLNQKVGDVYWSWAYYWRGHRILWWSKKIGAIKARDATGEQP